MKRFRMEEDAGLEDVDVFNSLSLFSLGSVGVDEAGHGTAAPLTGRLFRCKSCSRQFSSFQALGGHRASRKMPRLAGGDGNVQAARPKPRVHECAICGLEFAMGQALGGHMRRHRGATEGLTGKPTAAAEKRGVLGLDLDLNIPARKEKDGDFLTLRLGLPMVDCFH